MIPLRDDNPVRTVPVVTKVIVAVNVAIFFLTSAYGLQKAVVEYGAIPGLVAHPSLSSKEYVTIQRQRPVRDIFGRVTLATVQEDVPVPSQKLPALLTLLTSMFLHGGLMHLAGNMWFLWIFGDNVEDLLGHGKFLLFYLVTGLAAAASHVAVESGSLIPIVGASGAISGVMGAYMRRFPWAGILTLVPIFFFIQIMRVPAIVFLGVWFLFQVLSAGGGGSGIAWFAHIGGFVAGFVLVDFLARRPAQPRRRVLRYFL